MAVLQRGLPDEYGHHFSQFGMELFQRATANSNTNNPYFPLWAAVVDTTDTGGRSGLARRFWGGGREYASPEAVVDDGMPLGDNHLETRRVCPPPMAYAFGKMIRQVGPYRHA